MPFVLLFLSSCNIDSSDKPEGGDIVYLGGNIINPVDSVVYFYSKEKESEKISTKLDEDNFFLFELDSLKRGLYTFRHGKEIQYVYLEKEDSLMLRLNTSEFDESLVYTGVGAAVNNYLIKRFLQIEDNKINMADLYSLEIDDFEHAIDSLKTIEYNLLSDYNYEGSGFSPNALKYTKNMLKYSEYAVRELYPINHTKMTKLDSLTPLNEHYFDFRANVNLNDSSLNSNEYYLEYLYYRLANFTIDSIIKVIPQKDFFNNTENYDIQYSQIRNYFISDIFTDQKIKNSLLFHSAYNLLGRTLTVKEIKKELIPFYSNVTDSAKIEIINNLLLRYTELQPGSPAPDFNICDGSFDQKEKMLSDYFGKPIYLFFWLSPGRYSWNLNLTSEYNKLKKQYPNIEFVSVFLDYPELWNESKKNSNANGIQLMADYKIVKKKYLLSRSTSFVLIDKEGIIIETNTSWPTSELIKKKLEKLN